jgi:hypothetical protein
MAPMLMQTLFARLARLSVRLAQAPKLAYLANLIRAFRTLRTIGVSVPAQAPCAL